MSPTLPQPAPLQAQTLEAGKGLARHAQAEQPLDSTGSAPGSHLICACKPLDQRLLAA